mmetsp:Transcript_52938/g.126002  ORF Transcript_52938/g.126002 Transcript_52938/m.126002 type:complete len:99 (+) Transcript_52938:65-361(+)
MVRKRKMEEYAAEELRGGRGGDEESSKRRTFDVLTRLRIPDAPTRECCTCGRVTIAQDKLHSRWRYACPMSGGRWRAPLDPAFSWDDRAPDAAPPPPP